MAWIKVPHDLPDNAEVVAMATKLGIDQDAVVGKLLRVWIWFDKFSPDGESTNLSPQFIDRLVSCSGFAMAMEAIGLLTIRRGTIRVYFVDAGVTRRKMSVQDTVEDFAKQLDANSRRCGQVITKDQWANVLEHFQFSCAFCGSAGVPLTIEHLTPVSRGGGNEVGNIVPACEPCNYSKHDRFPLEWFFARRRP